MGKKNDVFISAACALAAVTFLFPGCKPGKEMIVARGPEKVLLEQAAGFETTGNLIAARDAYQKLVADFPNNKEIADWQRRAEQLNVKLLFSPVVTPKSVTYVVQAGDSLEKIAREHATTVEMIKRANSITEDKIFPGMKLKVWNAPFSIFVDKSQNLLLLKSGEEIVKSYTVATGSNNSTPVGKFKIVEKIVNPTWYKNNKAIPAGTPENILGTRWMGWDKEGYGIHGTTDPGSLGKQATAGCVRMSNQDVEELYAIVPQGTEVQIVD